MPFSVIACRLGRTHTTRKNSGFTLTELTIVLIIVALLAGGMLLPLTAQQEIRQTTETSRQLKEIQEALMGFATANGRLPCPAKSVSDGTESRTESNVACTSYRGLLPWATLGIAPSDGWGHLFVYSVAKEFADTAITLSSSFTNGFTIKTRDTEGHLVNLTTEKSIPAVVVSTGKNGYLSWALGQADQNADSPGTNDDEDTNASTAAGGDVFVSRPPSGADSPLGEFDDLVIWISPNILYNRMIAAGRLH